MDWLGDLSETVHTELPDDRFLAAIDLERRAATDRGLRPFRIAYLAWAVTPERYAHIGPLIEDMYQPARHSQSARGRVRVFMRAMLWVRWLRSTEGTHGAAV